MSAILVTGANRGIGLELVKQLAHRREHVIATCRDAGDDLAALSRTAPNVRIEANVDMRNEASLARLASALASVKIKWLVHNAGVLSSEGLSDLNVDAIKLQFEVNALAPLVLTKLLRDNLERGSKIGIITSQMGSIGDNGSGGYYGYRMSKAAVNMAGVSLARDLRGRGIAVALLHPGFVKTRMTGGAGNIDAKTSAQGLIARLDELTIETSGHFWHAQGHELPW